MAGKYTKKVNKRPYILLSLVAILLVAVATGFVAAKYIANVKKEAEIHASSFHFSSDYLASAFDSTPDHSVPDAGDHKISFHIYNYQKENIALVSEEEILYYIPSVSNGWSVAVEDALGAPVPVTTDNRLPANSAAYLLPANSATYHKVTLTKESASGNTVDVTVSSYSPYELSLKATFALVPLEGVTWSVSDMGDYTVVTITSNNFAGTVNVTWSPANHSPDNTDPIMADWFDSSSLGSFSAVPYSVYRLIFVENQAGSYDNSHFSVTTGA